MTPTKLIFLLTLGSCSLLEKQQKTVNSLEENWKGSSLAELEAHPYFKTLPLKDNIKTTERFERTYARRGKFQSRAYCESIAGCEGFAGGDCYHVFTIKQDIVQGYRQQGNCRIDDGNWRLFLKDLKQIPR